jgi:phosphoribosyl-ATP pyrophosphohydrolase
MIVPSIDLMNGHAVQLVGGKSMELNAGDPRPIAARFRLAGEIAVVDLDAALSRGHNDAVIRELIAMARCRVGGGIRSVDRAIEWLDAGAARIVLGTMATPEVLRELPKDRVIAALDAVDLEVVVDGWRTRTGRSVLDRMAELRELVGGFLVTFVEREGRMGGCRMEAVEAIVQAAGDVRVTIAGGVTTPTEVDELDRLGADAQVGMALYKGVLTLADAIAAPLRSDRPDGLWPTVVVDEQGIALGLCYSSRDSLREAVDTQRGVYWSRSRGELWRKGETSGATQTLLRIDLDCDRDALRFTVRQAGGGFCHHGTRTCWGEDDGLARLARTLAARAESAPLGSYTRRLFDDPALLASKLSEEAGELAAARSPDEVCGETADLMYFALVAMTRAGVSLEQVEAELARRALRITRRRGDAKPAPAPAEEAE